MDMYEFGKRCQKLYGHYKEIFGCIPVQTEFVCTREEFLDALEKSIQERKNISCFLIENNSEEVYHYGD